MNVDWFDALFMRYRGLDIRPVDYWLQNALRILQMPEDKTGCYLSVWHPSKPVSLLTMQAGRISGAAKIKRYRDLAEEKAERLLRLSVQSDQVLSRQSRDPDRDLWGGAVRFYLREPLLQWLDEEKETVFSISGLTESADEAFAAFLASQVGMRNELGLNPNHWTGHRDYHALMAWGEVDAENRFLQGWVGAP